MAARPPFRIGYGAGSVATGAFGTVPGLMLLPYLTDTLAVPALLAGAIVFLPKAWDVVLNPVAGRISDRTVDPRGPRRPWLLRAGFALAACFALLFAAPDLGSRAFDAALRAKGVESEVREVKGRNHITIIVRMALSDADPSSQELLKFVARHSELELQPRAVAANANATATATATATANADADAKE